MVTDWTDWTCVLPGTQSKRPQVQELTSILLRESRAESHDFKVICWILQVINEHRQTNLFMKIIANHVTVSFADVLARLFRFAGLTLTDHGHLAFELRGLPHWSDMSCVLSWTTWTTRFAWQYGISRTIWNLCGIRSFFDRKINRQWTKCLMLALPASQKQVKGAVYILICV